MRMIFLVTTLVFVSSCLPENSKESGDDKKIIQPNIVGEIIYKGFVNLTDAKSIEMISYIGNKKYEIDFQNLILNYSSTNCRRSVYLTKNSSQKIKSAISSLRLCEYIEQTSADSVSCCFLPDKHLTIFNSSNSYVEQQHLTLSRAGFCNYHGLCDNIDIQNADWIQSQLGKLVSCDDEQAKESVHD